MSTSEKEGRGSDDDYVCEDGEEVATSVVYAETFMPSAKAFTAID